MNNSERGDNGVTTESGASAAPRFWKTWRRLYLTLLGYWLVLVILMAVATRMLNP